MILNVIKLSYKKKDIEKKQIDSSKSAVVYLRNLYNKNTIGLREEFFALYLDMQNSIIGFIKVSEGGTTGTVCDIKLIMTVALKVVCQGIIISHNHPGGILKPSAQDFITTKKVKQACKIFNISLLDHIILTENDYLSFADDSIL